jgi:hypothetical protein
MLVEILICGGFIGVIDYIQTPINYVEIENCYSKGDIISTDNGRVVGGFIGRVYVESGKSVKLELENNYSTGKPTTTALKGGFISTIFGSGTKIITFTNNFWDSTTSLLSTTAGTATYKTTTEMKTPTTFSTWSTSIWNIVDGEYPTLKWDFTNVWNQVAGGNPTFKWQ